MILLTTQTRYFKNAAVNVNGLAAFSLATDQTGAAATLTSSTAGYYAACDVGIRVWKRTNVPAETEITAGTPVAIVTTGDGDLKVPYNNTYTPAATALNSTDSIVVRVYRRFSVPLGWVLIGTALFTTEQLGASQLDNVQWTVYYVLSETATLGPPPRSGMSFHFDGADNARIVNFSFTPAAAGRQLVILGDGLSSIIS